MKSLDVTRVIGIALLFLLLAVSAEAQIFPAGGLPMAYNGGFAGEAGKHRLVSASKINVDKHEKLFTRLNQTFSYDVFVPSLRSGIGVMAGFSSEHFNPSDSLNWELRNPYFLFAVSPKFSFGGKLTLAPFVDFQFVHSRNVTYYHWNRVDPPMLPTNSRYTLRTGFLLNWEKGYVGLTVVPLNRPEVYERYYRFRFVNYYSYFYSGGDDTKLILQAGWTFHKKENTKFSFTPQFAVSIYKEPYRNFLGLVDINMAFRFNRFHTGMGSGGFQFAYDWDRLRIGTALMYYRLNRKHGYTTFVNGQLTTVWPYYFDQHVSVRYLIDAKKGKL